jgi:hypothetical protein
VFCDADTDTHVTEQVYRASERAPGVRGQQEDRGYPSALRDRGAVSDRGCGCLEGPKCGDHRAGLRGWQCHRIAQGGGAVGKHARHLRER